MTTIAFVGWKHDDVCVAVLGFGEPIALV